MSQPSQPTNPTVEQHEPSLPSVETLESYLTTLTTMVHSISLIRHKTFPTMINNLQRPIQNTKNLEGIITTLPPPHNHIISLNQLIQSWRDDSQSIINGLQSLRHQAINSQDAMKYVRTSSKSDSRLTAEEKSSALAQTEQIDQKNKIEYLNTSVRSLGSSGRRRRRLSFNNPSSSKFLLKNPGLRLDHKLVEAELAKRKTFQKRVLMSGGSITSQRASFPIEHPCPTSTQSKTSLAEYVQELNRLDRSDHLLWISPHEVLLKEVMKVRLVFRSSPSPSTQPTSLDQSGDLSSPSQHHQQQQQQQQPLTVERVFCFGLNEPKTSTYQRSSFGLIRSINRCINHLINQSLESGLRSNLLMVCSLISSYKDFFKSEITTTSSSDLIDQARVNDDENPRGPSHGATGYRSGGAGGHRAPQRRRTGTTESGLCPPNSSNSRSFLTWRRWKFHPSSILKSPLDHPPPPPGAQDYRPLGSSSLDQVLNQGRWIKIHETFL